jgi:tRNA(adenine34) deaminase
LGKQSVTDHLQSEAVSKAEDEAMMRLAIEQAKLAGADDEVPVGAILVLDGEVIGTGRNQNITLLDPSAHAEMLAIKQGAAHIGNYRLLNTTLYVTLEPCAMCAGLLVHSRIGRLVIGTRDPKTGACGSVLNVVEEARFNHQIPCTIGVLGDECSALLSDFFALKRAQKKAMKKEGKVGQ